MRHRFLISTMLLLIAMRGIVGASDASDPYVAAANEAGVPLQVLVAVVGAESAYHPWALDIGGHQVFCQSRAEAEAVLNRTATGNVDIGLMQINWHYWGSRLGIAKTALLDPLTNLRMGALILRKSLDRDGTMWHRIGSYHSTAPRERDRYNREVYAAYLRYMRGDLTP